LPFAFVFCLLSSVFYLLNLFEQPADGKRHRAPALLLAFESPKTVLGDLINPRPAFVGGDYPAGLDEVRFLQAVQCGVERPFLDPEGVGSGLDLGGDGVAVEGPRRARILRIRMGRAPWSASLRGIYRFLSKRAEDRSVHPAAQGTTK
jgi:hypothetical protein